MSQVFSIIDILKKNCEKTGTDFCYEKSVESTNAWAKEMFNKQKKALFCCERQTQGRGRGENHWVHAETGDSLLSTWCYTLDTPPSHLTGPLLGLSVFQSCENVFPTLKWSLKAPNDIILNGHKVGGLLVESASQGSWHSIYVGFGMNVFDHPREIDKATHLNGEEGLSGQLTAAQFTQFIESLEDNFMSFFKDSTPKRLSPDQQEALLYALNLHPHKEEPFIEVTEQGDLVTESRQLRWQDL